MNQNSNKVKKILLVEDDPFVNDIYTTKFKEEGFEVEVAADGQDCLDKLKEKKPDLLVLDIVLPKIDGWEILKRIKEDENLKDLKVVILSNISQREDVEKGLKFGAIEYFIKAHYTPTEICEKIKKILK
jgi:DNA-binding response OmpR family regulator